MDQARDRTGTLWGLAFASAALLPFAVWAVARSLTTDLWYDEVWSLQHYALSSFHHVVTDYSHPNNHVFYNVLQHLWLDAVGIDTLNQALAAPAWVRLPSLLYALGCALCLARLGRDCYGRIGGWLAPAALVTCMPFFHFAVQARGYALSMLLIAWLMWHVRRAAGGPRRGDLLAVPLLTAMALYTLPSNLFAVLAIAAWYGASCAAPRRRSSAPAGRARQIVTLLALGTVLGGLLYAPMLEQILAMRGTMAAGPPPLAALPSTLRAMISHHWLLLALLIPGLVVATRRDRIVTAQLLCLLLAPFGIAAATGDRPYPRVFVVLTPIAALLLVAGAAALLRTGANSRPARLAATGLLIAICHGQFAWHVASIDRGLRTSLGTGAKPQGLDQAYFSGFYHPEALARQLRAAGFSSCVLRDGDLVAMRAHLELHGVEVLDLSHLRATVLEHGKAPVITAHPTAALDQIRTLLPAAHAELQETHSYHRVLLVTLATK